MVTVTLSSVGPQGPAGPAPEWGNITGTLGDQTDLAGSLAGKAPSACLYLSGTTGNYITCADAAGLDITGDIDISAKVAPNDWSTGAAQCILSKWPTADGQQSYRLDIQTDGSLWFRWTADGTTDQQATSTQTVYTAGAVDGSPLWVRVAMDVDDGGVYKVYFYTSTDGTTWTQLGSTITGGTTTSIFSGTQAVLIGTRGNGSSEPLAGKFYRVTIKSGIGGSIAGDWRADIPAPRYMDSALNVWSVAGTANGWMVA
jgi:hypothetical protein